MLIQILEQLFRVNTVRLQIFANGDYIYTPNNTNANLGLVDHFTYTLADPLGGNISAKSRLQLLATVRQ